MVAGAREGAFSNVNADEWRATVDQNTAAVRGKKEESFDFRKRRMFLSLVTTSKRRHKRNKSKRQFGEDGEEN